MHGKKRVTVLLMENRHQTSKAESDVKGPDTFNVVYICISVSELSEMTSSSSLDREE